MTSNSHLSHPHRAPHVPNTGVTTALPGPDFPSCSIHIISWSASQQPRMTTGNVAGQDWHRIARRKPTIAGTVLGQMSDRGGRSGRPCGQHKSANPADQDSPFRLPIVRSLAHRVQKRSLVPTRNRRVLDGPSSGAGFVMHLQNDLESCRNMMLACVYPQVGAEPVFSSPVQFSAEFRSCAEQPCSDTGPFARL